MPPKTNASAPSGTTTADALIKDLQSRLEKANGNNVIQASADRERTAALKVVDKLVDNFPLWKHQIKQVAHSGNWPEWTLKVPEDKNDDGTPDITAYVQAMDDNLQMKLAVRNAYQIIMATTSSHKDLSTILRSVEVGHPWAAYTCVTDFFNRPTVAGRHGLLKQFFGMTMANTGTTVN